MKRVLRWAFNGAAAVSAVLFVVMLALCLLSYDHVTFHLHQIDRSTSVNIWRGRLLEWKEVAVKYRAFWGIDLHVRWSISLWFPIILTSAAPGAWGWWNRHRLAWYLTHPDTKDRRQLLGLCPSCGYDLRATPDV